MTPEQALALFGHPLLVLAWVLLGGLFVGGLLACRVKAFRRVAIGGVLMGSVLAITLGAYGFLRAAWLTELTAAASRVVTAP